MVPATVSPRADREGTGIGSPDSPRHTARPRSGLLRLLATYLRPYRWPIALALALLAAQAIANLYLPTLNADIIDNGVVKGDTHHIVVVGGVMLGVTLVMGVAAVISVRLAARSSMAFGRDLRSALFRRVESFSQMELNHFGTHSLITRATNDVQQVQMMALLGLTMMAMAPIMGVGGMIMALRLNLRLSLSIVVILPIMAGLIALIATRAVPLFRAMQTKIDRINRVMRETLAGIRVIRAFDRTEADQHRFAEANADLTDTTLRVTRLFALLMPGIMLVLNLSTVAVMWFGSLLVGNGDMLIGDLIAFLTYLLHILFSVLMATMMFVMVPRAAASADRIQQVLDTMPAIADPEVPAPSPPRRGTLEFRDVEFRYPGAEAPVLSRISFATAPGETTAIVGSTGSGKSTLVNLVPRFYEATAGTVLVDGTDVRLLTQEDLWSRIGFVPQRAFLFSGTVASNVRDGNPEATDDEVWHALEVAAARDFVVEMGGLEAPIDQGGANLSGGQRQRLAIARAAVRRPHIYVFDDSFSSLDFTTDARLRAALRAETREATVLIVAQRVGTIMHADRIVVLAEGSVAGVGTHQQLLDTCETYREIVYSQVTPEEAA
ncbi:MAG TPA: ABC transporter ATP-binding protein [Acidimicrobiia bacterium]|nr:ABC transporter ATP-binding protein [Acidimicrobiia bacterium]